MGDARPPLGTLTPNRFLRQHWQKLALFLPAAITEARQLLSPPDVLALAGDERCRSRLVSRRGNDWRVEHGPFDPARLRRLPAKGWALLVQDVNLVSRAAHDLMMRFDFIPQARMDDLMVSLAPEGGGVGPHFDSYDVFLVQGVGTRRWEVSDQRDLTLHEGLPLRILKHFSPDQAYDCHPGDMLYLPPGVSHNGVALETCMTYSVGFRSPSMQELVSGFLAHLDDTQGPGGLYADPDLRTQTSPSMIPQPLLNALGAQLAKLDISAGNVRHYLGSYLTEPQPHVVFSPPARPLSRARFAQEAVRRGIELSLATRMLWAAGAVFINGEHVQAERSVKGYLTRLADQRYWQADSPLPEPFLDLLYEWYRAGYLLLRRGLPRPHHPS